MSLTERICHRNDSGIRVNGLKTIANNVFYAMFIQLDAGTVTRDDIENYFDMSAPEKAQLTIIINRYNSAPDKTKFLMRLQSLLYLAEINHPDFGTPAALIGKLGAL